MAWTIDQEAFRHAQEARSNFLSCERFYTVLFPEAQRRLEEIHRLRQQKARGAEDRAAGLLRTRLGQRDYALFQRTGSLMRPSRLWPGVEYLVPAGGHEMVRVIRDGREQQRLCVVAAQGEPSADRTLTILDLIETDERRLWEMANLHPPPGQAIRLEDRAMVAVDVPIKRRPVLPGLLIIVAYSLALLLWFFFS